MFDRIKDYHLKYSCRATLLTPVHIGTGREIDFGTLQKRGDGHAMLDLDAYLEQETADINDPQELAERINEITRSIETDSFESDDFPILRRTDVANFDYNKTFREHIHSDRVSGQKLYLPGSSLKGSIQTAFVRKLLQSNGLMGDYTNPPFNEYQFNRQYSRQLESATGGIQGSLFRFLQVPDIVFSGTDSEILKSRGANYNDYREDWAFTGGRNNQTLDVWLECIPAAATADFTLTVPKAIIDAAQGKNLRDMQTALRQSKNLTDPEPFFRTLKNHTLRLVTQEIDDLNPGGANPKAYISDHGHEELNLYLDNLIEIEDELKALPENQAIIRVGYGSGWRFMTGNWQEDLLPDTRDRFGNDEWTRLKSAVRGPRYKDVEYFPKSRRMTGDSRPLGFIRLEMV